MAPAPPCGSLLEGACVLGAQGSSGLGTAAQGDSGAETLPESFGPRAVTNDERSLVMAEVPGGPTKSVRIMI